MIGLLQRVRSASVTVDGTVVGEIGRGLLVLAAVRRGDTNRDALRLAERILGYRVFPDERGRMNLSLAAIGGELYWSRSSRWPPTRTRARGRA